MKFKTINMCSQIIKIKINQTKQSSMVYISSILKLIAIVVKATILDILSNKDSMNISLQQTTSQHSKYAYHRNYSGHTYKNIKTNRSFDIRAKM